jgi:hypothetical protein
MGGTSYESRELFNQLNAGSPDLLPGQIVLFADPCNKDQAHAMHALQAAKAKIDESYRQLDRQEASFLGEHYAALANFSSIADKGVGLAGDSMQTYFERLEDVLRKIQDAHRNTYQATGKLAGEAFYAERRRLFSELDGILPKFMRKRLGLEDYPEIKQALNLSTHSLVHHWEDVGVGEIPGYATYIENASRYAKWMKAGGYAAIGFSALHSGNEIYHACTTGRESECKQTTFKEVGRFAVGVRGGLLGGEIGNTVGVGTCSVVLGLASIEIGGAGALFCGIAGMGIGSYYGGEFGDSLGEGLGNLLYGIAR